MAISPAPERLDLESEHLADKQKTSGSHTRRLGRTPTTLPHSAPNAAQQASKG